MKAYLKVVDQNDIERKVAEIIKLEQFVSGKNKIEINSKLIKNELNILFSLSNIKKLQIKLKEARTIKDFPMARYYKNVLKFFYRDIYKDFPEALEEYKNFLNLLAISKLDKSMLVKILEDDEFNKKLSLNPKILNLLSHWIFTKNLNTNRLDFYKTELSKLRSIMHNEDLNN